MVEITGAMLVFYGLDGALLAKMETPVRLESYGKVTLVVDGMEIPAAAKRAVKYQVILPLPVIYEASELTVMLTSQMMLIPGAQT